MTTERLDAASTALIVFDMQKGQMRVNDPQRQQWLTDSNIVGHCVDLVAVARRAGVPVFYVRNNRRDDGADQADLITDLGLQQAAAGGGGGGTPPADRWDMVDELAPQPQDFIVDKIRFGAFSSTALDTLLRARGIQTVVMCGVRTTVGVATSVRDGRDLGYHMVVASDATGGVAPEDHQWMLEHIFPMFGRVRSVREIEQMLG